MDLGDVLRAVEATYRGGAVWPDPHLDREVGDVEYSRVTDPDRYRIVGARAAAWERALVELGLATAQREELPDWPYGPQGLSAIRLKPRTADALSLVVVHGAMEMVPDTAIGLGVGTPPVLIAIEPDCGCDACDAGSADLLEAVDRAFLDVVSGDILYAEGAGWTLIDTETGSQSSGDIEPAGIAAAVRRGDSVGSRVLLGSAWISESG